MNSKAKKWDCDSNLIASTMKSRIHKLGSNSNSEQQIFCFRSFVWMFHNLPCSSSTHNNTQGRVNWAIPQTSKNLIGLIVLEVRWEKSTGALSWFTLLGFVGLGLTIFRWEILLDLSVLKGNTLVPIWIQGYSESFVHKFNIHHVQANNIYMCSRLMAFWLNFVADRVWEDSCSIPLGYVVGITKG